MRLDRLNAVQINQTFVSKIPSDSINEFINCLSPIASRMEKILLTKSPMILMTLSKDSFCIVFGITDNQKILL